MFIQLIHSSIVVTDFPHNNRRFSNELDHLTGNPGQYEFEWRMGPTEQDVLFAISEGRYSRYIDVTLPAKSV